MNQPGKVANPACGQLNWKMKTSLSPFAPENLVSRDGFIQPGKVAKPARGQLNWENENFPVPVCT